VSEPLLSTRDLTINLPSSLGASVLSYFAAVILVLDVTYSLQFHLRHIKCRNAALLAFCQMHSPSSGNFLVAYTCDYWIWSKETHESRRSGRNEGSVHTT
jgi:hypothetical protein